MDSMNIKHLTCFGPCMVREWKLESKEEEVLQRWNRINLYSATRGINRFKGLALALKETDASLASVFGINELVSWTMNAKELSNRAVKEMIKANPIFKKALLTGRQFRRSGSVMV